MDLTLNYLTHIPSIKKEYMEYVEQKMSTIFSFEDWLEQTHPELQLSNEASIKSN